MIIRRNRRRRYLDGSAGFTLVEMMITLTIVAIGILAVGQLFIFSQIHARHAREETMAAALAQELREKTLSEPYETVAATFDGVDTDAPDTITAPCQTWADHLADRLGEHGRGTIQVLDHLADPEIVDGMLTILITITWLEAGALQTLEVRFSIARMK